MPGGSNPPRPPLPPSPPPSQHPAHGHAGSQSNFASILPHSGHQADLHHINFLLSELAELNQRNRQDSDRIFRNLDEFRLRASQTDASDSVNEPQLNGEDGSARQKETPIEVAELKSKLNQAVQNREDILNELVAVATINSDYEDTFESMMIKVREFAHAHATALIDWHRHYNKIIEDERSANLALRMEHGQWQASLGRALDCAREALKAQSEANQPLEKKISYLKRENKTMRRLLGWTKENDSDDEREEKQLQQEKLERERKAEEERIAMVHSSVHESEGQ